jgi:hypothetical protein
MFPHIFTSWAKWRKFMKSDYERLIELAAETDTPSTPEKIKELNVLLSQQSIDSIEKEHSSLLDDLISILSNTNNLCVESRESIIALQDAIRSE